MLEQATLNQSPIVRNLALTSRTFLAKLLLVIAAGYFPLLSFAQSPEQSSQDTAEIEEVVVTGSRLLRRDISSPSPVVTLGKEDISVSATGNVTLEDTLNEWPQLVADVTSSLNSPGRAGVLTADLRGLGATRTLVLVDGRRYIPGSAAGLVDLASIPQSLVQSVEIITGGASAVYGSDAIAGAINFKLRDDLDGFELNYTYLESSKGDAGTHDATASFGTQFADNRGYALISATFTKRDPVFFADRAFSDPPMIDGDGVNLVPSGSGNIPGVGLRLSPPQIASLVGVDLTNTGTVFGVGSVGGGNATCGNIAGVRFGDGGEVLPFCRPENNFNFAARNHLLRPLERTQITALARLDIGQNISAFGQFFFTHKENSFQQAPESIVLQTSGAGGGILLVPNAATSPLFSQPVRDFFANNAHIFDPDGDGTARLVNAGRRFEELGLRPAMFTTDSYNLTVGFEGDINLQSSAWKWNIFGQTQRAEEDTLLINLVSSLKLTLALDTVVDSSGNVVCRNVLIGCVPINPFGIDSLTPEMAEFLSTPASMKQIFERNIVGGGIAGDLFDLPAGAVPFAIGFEARKDKFQVLPDEVNLTNQTRNAVTERFDGSMDVAEVYVEIRIPLLSDLTLFDELAVEGAARYSDYSTVGGVSTYKAGVDWRVNDDVRFRGSFNRAIRAPSLNELFSPRLRTTTGATDPCDSLLNPSQAVKDFCIVTGVPADIIDDFLISQPQYDQIVGGNPDLSEEKSDTWTYGVVVTPSFAPGLEFSLDYYDVKVDNAISIASSSVVLDTCFSLRDPNSSFCQSISRFETGVIRQIDSTNQNFASLSVRGIDLQAFYTMDLPSDALLDFRLAANWQLENSETPLPGRPKIECAGFFAGPCSSQDTRNTPDHTGAFTTTYSRGPATLRGQVRWIDKLGLFPGARRAVQKIDSIIYVDLNGSYQLMENVLIAAGVNNVFDEQPTIVGFFAGGDPNVDPSTYDVVGRRYFVSVRLKF